ncbi:iron uptake porin [Myxosarcina sp. GI1(2024)]
MFKLITKLLLVSPAIAGIVLSWQSSIIAQTPVEENTILDGVNRYSQESNDNSVNQVTNVNQLRDVEPTDWAYEALRSLVDRYGCIAGYPNQTYRGSQALTRYEFAAGLNSCLNQIERLIASSEAVTREDLDTMSRLAQEFEAELATLGGRIDNLESRTAFLEDNQFSTTTKLEGEVVFGIASEFNYDNETVFQDRVRLAFVSSFTGEDALYTRLDASNASPFEEIDTGALTYQTADSDNEVSIGWLAYYFPIGDKIDVYLPAAFPLWQDFVPTLSPYLDAFTGATGSLSSFAESSPIYKIGLASGGGLGVNYTPLEFVTISGGYFADTSFDPSEGNGLFNGGYSALGQVTLSFLEDRLQVAGTYVRGYFTDENPEIFDLGVGVSSGVNPFDTATATNSYGVEAAFQFTDRIAFNAFGVYTDANELGGDGEEDIWSYGAGVAFPDLGKEGNLGAIFAGAEPYGGNSDVPIHLEGFYKYQLNDNISLTPGVIYIISPNGNNDEDDAIVGVLRTTFTF